LGRVLENKTRFLKKMDGNHGLLIAGQYNCIADISSRKIFNEKYWNVIFKNVWDIILDEADGESMI